MFVSCAYEPVKKPVDADSVSTNFTKLFGNRGKYGT